MTKIQNSEIFFLFSPLLNDYYLGFENLYFEIVLGFGFRASNFRFIRRRG